MPRFKSPRVAAVLVGAAALLLSTAGSARADDKADVKAAVQRLTDAKSYTYTTSTEGGQGGINATGKVEKDGYTSLEMTVRNNTVKVVRKGEKLAADTGDGWQSAADLRGAQGPARMIAGMARTYKTPAEQAEQVLADATEVKKGDGGTYTAELPEAAAKKMMTPGGGRRAAGGGGGGAGAAAPTVANAKVTVTFTLADGSLTKMESHMTGTVTRNGNDQDVDRTTTTAIKDIDKTTADVPAEAKAKLEGGPTTKP